MFSATHPGQETWHVQFFCEKKGDGNTSRLGRDGSLAQGRQDVGAVTAAHVTLRAVVADGEPRAHAAVDGAGRAVLRSAADRGGGDPDDLREMAPRLKVGHVGVAFSVAVGGELPDLAVVPHVGDGLGDNLRGVNAGNVTRGTVHSNVLAVRASGSTGGPKRDISICLLGTQQSKIRGTR